MRKSSIILLGYGLGYIIISFLVAFKYISLSTKDILPLSIASLIFALAEFWDSGLKLLILSVRQLAFRFFAMMAFARFRKFKIYVEKKYLKKPKKSNVRFNFEMYFYWYNKCIANHFSRTIRRQYIKLQNTSVIALLLNIAAPISLVVLLTIMPHNLVQTSEAFNNAISLMPLGLMFINVFFESEFAAMSENFFEKVDVETNRLKEESDDFREMMSNPKTKSSDGISNPHP